MSNTLDLISYAIEADGRELVTRPNSDGYAHAVWWLLLMLLLLGCLWWGAGGTTPEARAHRAFTQLPAAEQKARRARAVAAEQRLQEISAAIGEEQPRPRPIASALYRGGQLLCVVLGIAPFVLLQFIRPRVRYDGLPGQGVLIVTIVPWLWTYRRPVNFFGAITPAVERKVRLPNRRAARRGVAETDAGFVWMVRLTPQPVADLMMQANEFRINLSLSPDKGMVRNQLPKHVRDVVRFLEGVTGLQHDRILVQDVTAADALAGCMTMRLEQIPVSRSPDVGR
ncbi:MAG: hypothetical protein EBU59_13970, partial [Planctomycetia bacterium]|nr:hypothetical protein [Planctomycetia bacterium]